MLSNQRFGNVTDIPDDPFASPDEDPGSSPTTEALHAALGPAPGAAICDVGCGAGHMALSFAGQRPSRLVGVDPAPGALKTFAARAAERALPVETVEARAEELPLDEAAFDLVVSRFAGHRFRDAAGAVAEMTRLLRPGGRLAVVDLEGHEEPLVDAFNHALAVLHDPGHQRSCTLAEWIGFFQRAGLNVPVARGSLAESREGVPVGRWCERASCGAEAEAAIRQRLAEAPRHHLEALGIRRAGDEFLMPLRACLVVGVKPLTGC
ncbi:MULTISPECIES: class I SAM-dependent methyltransferase [unclassified Streptomyces]|uniref:class I SAM-dependent methyltransferase n=1 Tax=unclassified Streptomyces TaxID=2593676 RepID=UPI0022B704E2|nr:MULTISPECIES: class I SAM-dependent methyltransferase [unclassified Streptomyces]MCZ7416929.1 class I SAM-dependent methyltransferase [Streptomyces sp. WMMC897]MCZ7433241.1 class I SAM-dependent methyltransferase [Streptomyces sp. WMMC1477]